MWKRARILALLAALAVVVAVLGCARSDDSLAVVKQRGTLRVGLDASFPPFESVAADGTLEGLDVDLARLIAQRLVVGLGFRNIAFDGLYDALTARQVDVVISALPHDPLRTRDVAFSAGYFEDGTVLVGPGNHAEENPQTFPPPPVVDALRGRLGVEMGSESAVLARQAASGVTMVQFMSESEVMDAVADGIVDWGLASRVSACLYRHAGGAITIGPQLTRTPYCLALRASDSALARAVFEALQQVTASQEWQQSRSRWLGEGC
jgi:ABC-type amino acid transport substrate-binding protein